MVSKHEMHNHLILFLPSLIIFYNLRGYKVPKISKFASELEENTIEHVVCFQIECGDLAIDEFLEMKYFSSSSIKNAFTWFTTLPPNLIYVTP